MKLTVDRQGKVACLYNEKLALEKLGKVSISRASYVEPFVDSSWCVDILDGPFLAPFKTRTEALKAETLWLEQNRL